MGTIIVAILFSTYIIWMMYVVGKQILNILKSVVELIFSPFERIYNGFRERKIEQERQIADIESKSKDEERKAEIAKLSPEERAEYEWKELWRKHNICSYEDFIEKFGYDPRINYFNDDYSYDISPSDVEEYDESKEIRELPYKEYLKTDHWKKVRKQVFRQRGKRCQVCGASNNLDIHHTTYERIGKEKLEDLTVLCRECHDLFHKHGKLRY